MAKTVVKKKTEDLPVRSIVSSYPENHGELGKRIELGSKTHISKNKAGMKVEFFTPTIQVLIGIGKDHVAYLLMDEDAWVALKKGQKINIDTLKDFTTQFL
jgi:hypothetical protein